MTDRHRSGETAHRQKEAAGRLSWQLHPSLISSRASLCAALDALTEQVAALTVVGSHAVHEQTRGLGIDSTTTKDGDLAVTPELVSSTPSISERMRMAGFKPLMEIAGALPDDHPGSLRWSSRPGLWGTAIDSSGEPVDEVDLLVPEVLAGRKGRAAKTLPDHGRNVIGRVEGIELAVLERDLVDLENFADGTFRPAYVARPAGLICAKAFKITDRLDQPGTRRAAGIPKDLVDLWRCMASSDPQEVRAAFSRHTGGGTGEDPISEGQQRFRRLLRDPTVPVRLDEALSGLRIGESAIEELIDGWQPYF